MATAACSAPKTSSAPAGDVTIVRETDSPAEALQGPKAPEAGADLRSATTSSLAAYQDYTRGLRHLYRWEFEEAKEAFEAAIKADSTFALAHYRLAIAWNLAPQVLDPLPMWSNEKAIESAKVAARFANRLTWRDRQAVLL